MSKLGADGVASFGLKDYSQVSISLSAEQRPETNTICLRPKVDNVNWKRALAIILSDRKRGSRNYLPDV